MRKILLLLMVFLTGAGVLAEESPVTAEFKFDFPDEPQLRSFFQNYEKDLREEILAKFEEARAEGPMHNSWSLDVGAEVTYKGKFWVVQFSGYDYRGGAHGVPHLNALYFNPETFEQIPQDQLLRDGAYDTLSELSRKGLVEQDFDPEDEWMIQGTVPTPENFALVVPHQEGVRVIFNSYQVAPYAAGTPSVELSWPVAAPLFREAYRP